MASTWYVRSGAGGTASGADWANAKLTIAAAITASAAGDTFYVSEDHAETSASTITNTFKGTPTNPDTVLCVNHAGSVPPVAADLRTTATVTTTVGGISTPFNVGGSFYMYGITYDANGIAGSAANLGNTGAGYQRYKLCTTKLSNASAVGINVPNQSGANIYLEDHTFSFSAAAQKITLNNGSLVWKNTGTAALAGAATPTTLFNVQSQAVWAFLEGLDLSALGSGNTIFSAANASQHVATLKDCKLGASVTVASGFTAIGGAVNLIRSDSGATNYREESYTMQGTQSVETTIVRTGGASDGVTTQARKLVTTSSAKWKFPFECTPITIWNDTVGSAITVTLYGTTTGGGVPNDDDIWFDVEYMKDTGDPQGGFVTSTKATILTAASAVNNTSDGSTWGGGGAGNGFKMVSPSFTPQQKGPITIYVKVGKASATYYVDPKPLVT